MVYIGNINLPLWGLKIENTIFVPYLKSIITFKYVREILLYPVTVYQYWYDIIPISNQYVTVA